MQLNCFFALDIQGAVQVATQAPIRLPESMGVQSPRPIRVALNRCDANRVRHEPIGYAELIASDIQISETCWVSSFLSASFPTKKCELSHILGTRMFFAPLG
jgi:hypothetical protein